jgi:hypothetical protein
MSFDLAGFVTGNRISGGLETPPFYKMESEWQGFSGFVMTLCRVLRLVCNAEIE